MENQYSYLPLDEYQAVFEQFRAQGREVVDIGEGQLAIRLPSDDGDLFLVLVQSPDGEFGWVPLLQDEDGSYVVVAD